MGSRTEREHTEQPDDPTRRIVSVVARLDPALGDDRIRRAVEATMTRPSACHGLAAELEADPGVLTRGSPLGISKGAVRLIHALVAQGSTVVTKPLCGDCGRPRPLGSTDADGNRICESCRARTRPGTACGRCGNVGRVSWRSPEGIPVCPRCRQADPETWKTCVGCGRLAPSAQRSERGPVCPRCSELPVAACSSCGEVQPCRHAGGGPPVCASCYPYRQEPCATCGRTAAAAARWPIGPACSGCYARWRRSKIVCSRCGKVRRGVPQMPTDPPLCFGCAGRPGPRRCQGCGEEEPLHAGGRCAACAFDERLRRVLGGPGGEIPSGFQPLCAILRQATSPEKGIEWLARSSGTGLLARIASGEVALSHLALDNEPLSWAVEHLRALLVAGGLLEARDEAVGRLERWVRVRAQRLERLQDRRLVLAYARWHVVPGLRRRSARGTAVASSDYTARAKLAAAIAFLEWLGVRGTELAGCTQADVDAWLARPSAQRYLARHFVTWAHHAQVGPRLLIPLQPRRSATPPVDADDRWHVARRLLQGEEIDLRTRVAGLLVLVYGQTISRVARLRLEEVVVEDEAVTVQFGDAPVVLEEPLAGLVRTLVSTPRGHSRLTACVPSPWLFPGGAPGRPITAEGLLHRLRRVGIQGRSARAAALMQLAANLPAVVLARLLGIHPDTAERWAAATASDFARYAGQRGA